MSRRILHMNENGFISFDWSIAAVIKWQNSKEGQQLK